MYDESVVLGRVGSVFGNMLGPDPFGGGGTGGHYVFTDLAQLDAVTTRWRAERDTIQLRTEKIERAIDLAAPPAQDLMSAYQVEAFKTSLRKLKEHNLALFNYANGYVRKLEGARASYTETDETSALRMTNQHAGS